MKQIFVEFNIAEVTVVESDSYLDSAASLLAIGKTEL